MWYGRTHDLHHLQLNTCVHPQATTSHSQPHTHNLTRALRTIEVHVVMDMLGIAVFYSEMVAALSTLGLASGVVVSHHTAPTTHQLSHS